MGNAVKKVNSKAKFTKEGHGGSEAIIASIPGSPQMIGKWFGGGSDPKKGQGFVFT